MGNDAAPSAYRYPIGLFQAFGVELEYMIVDRDSLDVRPLCDKLLHHFSGTYDNEILPDGDDGPTAWSNELALHVVEFKTAGPAPALTGLGSTFADQARRANDILAQWNARLMPTAMHPWMNPHTEMHLWPHGYSEVYAAFDRIFSCSGHGWANLQSMHINLPFADDAEFRRLHTAIRTVLPLLPALAASSPVMDGRVTGTLDNRLVAYRGNCARVPAITGRVVPEPVTGRSEYDRVVFQPIYRALAPLDPDGTLRHEWANARGCIARFERGTVEVRLLDVQECPAADLAIAELLCATVRALADERLSSTDQQLALPTEDLYALFTEAVARGDQAVTDYGPLLDCLHIRRGRYALGELWREVAGRVLPGGVAASPALATILEKGCLARRIVGALGDSGTSRPDLDRVYRELCDCLAENRLFEG